MKLHVFAKQEDEGPKLKKQKHKAQLDERKLDKLLAAQKKEHEARVSEETGGLLFEANVAKAELKLNARDAELEAKFLAEKLPSWTVVADDLSPDRVNPFWSTYGPAPRAAYLVDVSGKIVHSQLWWEPDRSRRALDTLLAKRAP